MIAYNTGGVFVEIWIGTEDKLPRMLRAIYGDDPLKLRHRLELTNWHIDPNVSADFFTSEKATAAKRNSLPVPMRRFRHQERPSRNRLQSPSPHLRQVILSSKE